MPDLAPLPPGSLLVERHEYVQGEQPPPCIGQWCCGCPEHPIGKPWGWNSWAWSEHYTTCPKYAEGASNARPS